MKKILFTLSLYVIPMIILAQYKVSGIVVDEKTKQPLAGASVFCQNTTIGTLTNSNGEFSISVPSGGYDIVVSYSGYETQSQRISKQTENLEAMKFVLKEKEKSMEEVSVVATTEVKNGLEKYGAFFREQFIGITENSALCQIENPQVLRFFYSKKKNRLKIIADQELIINNKALGYRIKYQLDSFIHEYGTTVTQFTGYPLFEEMQGTAEEAETWKQKREEAYLGSLTHFFRSYYDNSLGAEGFKIEFIDKAGKPRPLNDPYDKDFAVLDNEELELHPASKLRVAYLNELPEKAYLVKNKLSENNTIQISQLDFRDAIGIERNGYFYDQRDLLTIGYWGWEKLADFMPYDYVPAKN
ncbi:MAG TPA: carboxypeptidase-like regulatory domain-containing protein [Chitinophagaceae bacterium]|nr:carboxypeptidase-like regulatory domain-containing protein [Chitinophagaceae bacterium]